MTDDHTTLTPERLAARWGCKIQTLANMRAMGHGPRYMKPTGRVVYALADVLEHERSTVVETGK